VRATLVAVVAVLFRGAVPAFGFWGSGAETIKALEVQFDAGHYESVVAQLDPAGLLKLGGENLRRGYLLLGASYEKIGHQEKTLSVYQVGVRLFPRDKELLSRLALLLHHAGLEEDAQPLFERLVQIEPGSPYGHLGLAQIDRALGFLDRSADHYKKTLAALPGRGDIWQEYGEGLFEARDYRNAELALRRALELVPGSVEATLDLALILRAMGRVDDALSELDGLVRAGRVEALRARALWSLEAGRDEEAAAAAAALLGRLPKDPLGLYVRARLGLQAGHRAQALADLQAAAAQETESPFAARVCAALAKLGQDQR
jgi:tetratricopeptide (TPR) repeat protein